MVTVLVVCGVLGVALVIARHQIRSLRGLAAEAVSYEPVAITAEGSQLVGRLDDGRLVIVNGHDPAWLTRRRGDVRPDGDFAVRVEPGDRWSCVLRYDDGSDPARGVVDSEVQLPFPGPGGPS